MRYETRAVLAGAYRGKAARLHATLTHVLDTKQGRTLCGRVKADSLADAGATATDAAATCEACNQKDPRNQNGPDDGPRSLKHIFQF